MNLSMIVNLILENRRAFFSSMAIIFAIVFVQNMGFKPPKKASAQPVIESPAQKDKFEEIKPQLEQNKEEMKLNLPASFIPRALARGDFEYDAAQGYGVVDLDTGNVLAEKNFSKQLPMASLTKIMTAVVAMDLVGKDQLLRVSKRAELQEPTKIVLLEGQQLTLEELLNAILLTSANDAAYTIRDGIDRIFGEKIFIAAMNHKAQYLGLKNTHFTNPAGFDNLDHYSSVEDLVKLTNYAYQNYPLFGEIVKKDYEFLPLNQYHTEHDLYNWNGLIGVYPGAYGVKIGNTDDAGKTTIVAANRAGKRIMVVLLNTPGVIERDMWASQLLDLGFESAAGLPPIGVTQEDLKEKYSTWRYGD